MVASLAQLLELMRHHGAYRIYAKRLAPNDNSKNQPYLSRDFSAMNIIPHDDVYTDDRVAAGSRRNRAKANIRFFWIDEAGRHLARHTKLILYPKYPEVRLSGFLLGCAAAPRLMATRAAGRILFLGITRDGDVLGYAADAASPITAELNAHEWETLGVLLELPLSLTSPANPKTILLDELRRIYQLHWIASQKLGKDGVKRPYAARNGGGYTLEAELGISPNGNAGPDFMGWEIKQYGVGDFTKFLPRSPVTLMTPEPTGGIYKAASLSDFMRRFGYADKNGIVDRYNFGGVYTCLKSSHATTGLRMIINGFDAESGKVTDMGGGFALVTGDGEPAATWSFTGMMKHWNEKHAQAAYIPSLYRAPPPEYAYGAQILLCERTDFILFLKAFAAGVVYYDPAIKIENASSDRPVEKSRSQFRVRHAGLTSLYHSHETVLLTDQSS